MPLGGEGQNVGLGDFCHIFDFVATGGIRVSQTHVLLIFVMKIKVPIFIYSLFFSYNFKFLGLSKKIRLDVIQASR